MNISNGNSHDLTAGYCSLCRSKEIELYGTVLDRKSAELKKLDYINAHQQACEQAGCHHPSWYEFHNTNEN